MGQCCGGESIHKDEVELYKTKYAMLKSRRTQTVTGLNNRNSKLLYQSPMINFNIEKNNLTYAINDLLGRYNTIDLENSNYTAQERFIDKLRMDQLWNIVLSHNDDFTQSQYLLLDMREAGKESFLQKLRRINYSVTDLISDSLNINDQMLDKFYRFVSKKKIIVIIDLTEKVLILDDFISFLKHKNVNCFIRILDNDLDKEASISTKALVELLDKRISRYLPMIMTSLQYLPHLQSNKTIFINSRFDLNSLLTGDAQENIFNCYPDINTFIDNYNLSTICIVTPSRNILKKVNGASLSNFSFLQNSIIIEDISTLSDVYSHKKDFYSSLNNLHSEVVGGGSILILIDDCITDKNLVDLLLYYYSYLLLQINPTLLSCLALDNPSFPETFSNLMDKKIMLDEFIKQMLVASSELSTSMSNFTESANTSPNLNVRRRTDQLDYSSDSYIEDKKNKVSLLT